MGRDDRPVRVGLQAAVGVDGARIESLVNITPWPTKTPSSSVTPSQMKVWLEILQWRPTRRVLLDLDERADRVPVADPAAVEVDQVGLVNRTSSLEDYAWCNHLHRSPPAV